MRDCDASSLNLPATSATLTWVNLLATRPLIVCQTMGYIEKTLGGEEEPFIAKASFHRLYHGLPMECWSTLANGSAASVVR